jgi:hypothetical protein
VFGIIAIAIPILLKQKMDGEWRVRRATWSCEKQRAREFVPCVWQKNKRSQIEPFVVVALSHPRCPEPLCPPFSLRRNH